MKKHPNMPKMRDNRRPEAITHIDGLFKHAAGSLATMVSATDPFLSSESLREYCSLWSQDKSGIPKYIAEDPQIADIFDFSDEWYEDVAKIQIERENRERLEEEAAAKIKQDKEAQENVIKQSLDIQIDNIMNQHQYYLKKQCPVMIPQKSFLNHDEHRAYIRAFLKFEKIRPAKTTAEHQEYQNYLSLQNRVYSEQTEFMKLSYQIAKSQLSSYNTVPEIISNYVDKHVKHRCQRRLKYKSNYVDEQQIPLIPQDPKNKFINLEFSHKGHLLSLGNVPWFQLPNPHQLNSVPLKESVENKIPADVDNKFGTERVLHKTPVSEDENASFLAQHHKAKIVISSSTLRTLVDNSAPYFEKEWDIPVRVRTYTSKDSMGNEVSQRVVYLDKPMPKKLWTPLEKKQLFFKKACLAKMTKNLSDPFFRMKSPAMFHYNNQEVLKNYDVHSQHDGANPVAYDDNIFDLYENTECDSFGVENRKEYIPSAKKNRKNNIKKGDKKNESDECIMSDTSLDEMVIDETKLQTNNESASQINVCEENTQEDLKIENSQKDEKCNIIQEKENKSNLDEANKDRLKGKAFENCKLNDIKTTKKGVKRTIDNENKNKHDPKLTKSQPLKTQLDSINKKDQSEVKTDSKDMIDNLLDMQNSLFSNKKSDQNQLEDTDTEPVPIAPKIIPKPWTNTLLTKWEEFSEPINCPNKSGVNVHYQLFTLGYGSNQLANLHPEINVIVRHNIHGHSRFRKNHTQPSLPYLVFPKPENQAFFGCEVSSVSEITQQWIKLLVRPHVRLLEVRMCEKDGDMLSGQDRSINEVMKEARQPHINFQPHHCLATLYSVFGALSSQPTGDYLLHHDTKTGAHVRLMKATEPNQVVHQVIYDLHAAYAPLDKVLTRLYKEPPWLAIDTHILTPFHLKHAKIPGTFPMKNPSQLSKK
ncbi:unnamed protein product, partial [Meganyctiphanes norvegica]